MSAASLQLLKARARPQQCGFERRALKNSTSPVRSVEAISNRAPDLLIAHLDSLLTNPEGLSALSAFLASSSGVRGQLRSRSAHDVPDYVLLCLLSIPARGPASPSSRICAKVMIAR
ncbi:MAG: hypothetical protein JWM63_1704 [Gammaproteobacteria bacterium]|nr:hypothetical protein [Gammaproteobacteria bacterium]